MNFEAPHLPINQETAPPPAELRREQDLTLNKNDLKQVLSLDKDELIKKLENGEIKVASGELKSLAVADILLQQKHIKEWLRQIEQDAQSYERVPAEIKNNSDFIALAIQKNAEVIEYLSDEQKNNIENLLDS